MRTPAMARAAAPSIAPATNPTTARATEHTSTHRLTPTSGATLDGGDLPALRRAIEHIDDALLELLSERQRLARQVGATKRSLGVPIADPAREAAVVRRVAERARELELDADATRELFRRVIALAREAQQSA